MDMRGFSKWKLWQDRNEIKGLEYPGIYALAISPEEELTNKEFKLIKEIVYFGMTCCGLKGRLQQFDNTVKKKRDEHGGAERFLFEHNDFAIVASNLYVSVNSMTCNPKPSTRDDWYKKGEIVQFEYICFGDYVDRYLKLPKFNDPKSLKK